MLKTKPDFSGRGLEIHFRAEQEQDRLGVDQDLDALVLDHFIEGLLLGRPFHGVFHAGAAAILDADAQAHDGRVRPGDDRLHARGGGIGQRHHLGAGSCSCLGHVRSPYHILSATRASSDMRR